MEVKIKVGFLGMFSFVIYLALMRELVGTHFIFQRGWDKTKMFHSKHEQ